MSADDRREPHPDALPSPELRIMGEIDWTEDFQEVPPEDALARAIAVPNGGRGREGVDE